MYHTLAYTSPDKYESNGDNNFETIGILQITDYLLVITFSKEKKHFNRKSKFLKSFEKQIKKSF